MGASGKPQPMKVAADDMLATSEVHGTILLLIHRTHVQSAAMPSDAGRLIACSYHRRIKRREYDTTGFDGIDRMSSTHCSRSSDMSEMEL